MRSTTVLLLASGAQVHGHVSMVYNDGQVGSIRNANGPTGNGQASVNSPCGGDTTFGSNGVGTIVDGSTVKLSMRYAAGHNGQFRMAYACGGGDGSELEPASATLTAAANGCVASGAVNGAYTDTAGAVGQDTLDIECTLPLQNVNAPTDCIIGILYQRDWGGCIDVSVLAAGDPLPPAPPPAPFIQSTGEYYFTRAGSVDTSAGTVAPEDGGFTYTCCQLGGALRVPDYVVGTPSITVSFVDATADECPASAPIKGLAPPENSATIPVASTFQMIVSGNGNKCARR